MIELSSNEGKMYIDSSKICYIREIDDEIVVSFSNGAEIRANKSELKKIINTFENTAKLI